MMTTMAELRTLPLLAMESVYRAENRHEKVSKKITEAILPRRHHFQLSKMKDVVCVKESRNKFSSHIMVLNSHLLIYTCFFQSTPRLYTQSVYQMLYRS
jgi:hypothetical protein